MPSARRTRTVAAAPQRVWALIEDPHHFPRWWPGVTRMEAVDGDRWTQVFTTQKGRPVRLDFRLVASEPPLVDRSGRRRWDQELVGSPFERVLHEAVTEIRLDPMDHGTRVTIEQRQKLRGYSRFGGLMLRRATRKRLEQALDGLEQACA
jgi:carbon monoxide dehydrogenase subunit G